MEFQFPAFSLTTFILLIFLFFFFIVIKKYNKKPNAYKLLPPGPWKLPLIGSMHHLATSSLLPHHCLKDLSQKYGPLFHLQLGEISAVVVSSPRLAKEVMKTQDLAFADRPDVLSNNIITYGRSEIAFAPYGDYWRQMRKIGVMELLSNKMVKSFHSIREQVVNDMIASIHSSLDTPINLSQHISALTSSIICKAAFGERLEGQGSLVALLNEAVVLLDGFDVADLFPSFKLHAITGITRKIEKIHQSIDKILNKIITKRREKRDTVKHRLESELNKEDLLDVLLRVQEEMDTPNYGLPITDNNIKAIIFEMFAGGTETTATVIAWAMAEMIKNPRVMEKARNEIMLNFKECKVMNFKGCKAIDETKFQELQYLKMVIKETLRLHPPLPLLLPRECRESCEIDGYQIPIKTKVIINAWAIGRCPDVWNEAERFIPDRFRSESVDEYAGNNFGYIPFGAGRRMCPGISFGLANIELTLAQLLFHFNWELPDHRVKAEDLDMTESSGLTAKRKYPLKLVATPSITLI